MKKYLQIICGLILCCTMLLTGCGQSGGQSSDTATTNSKAEAKGQLTISMLDIGQGDAVLIQTGAKNILIDTGDDKYYEDGKKGKENILLIQIGKGDKRFGFCKSFFKKKRTVRSVTVDNGCFRKQLA